jgi:hypothetical protein
MGTWSRLVHGWWIQLALPVCLVEADGRLPVQPLAQLLTLTMVYWRLTISIIQCTTSSTHASQSVGSKEVKQVWDIPNIVLDEAGIVITPVFVISRS